MSCITSYLNASRNLLKNMKNRNFVSFLIKRWENLLHLILRLEKTCPAHLCDVVLTPFFRYDIHFDN